MENKAVDCLGQCPTCDEETECHWQGISERGETLRCLACGTLFTEDWPDIANQDFDL